MIRLIIRERVPVAREWVDDGFGGRQPRPLRKAAPAGYTPIPGSRHGGYRKRQGDGWAYWYPSSVGSEPMGSEPEPGADAAWHRAHVDPHGVGAFVKRHTGRPPTPHHSGAALARVAPGEAAERFAAKAKAAGLETEHTPHGVLVRRPVREEDRQLRPYVDRRTEEERATDAREERALRRQRLEKAAPSRSWAVGAYTCELRKSAAGLVVLTVRGPKLPLPYHLVVGGEIDARRQAPGVVEELRAGRVPNEGVFRRDDEILPFRSAPA